MEQILEPEVHLAGSFNNSLKSAIFNSCVLPSLLYRAQTWNSTNKFKQSLNFIPKLRYTAVIIN